MCWIIFNVSRKKVLHSNDYSSNKLKNNTLTEFVIFLAMNDKLLNKLHLFLIVAGTLLLSCKTGGQDAHNNKTGNHLINESSPYLLQHAHNPVDWYPWNDEALQKAQKEDKLIIISIGYSSCHWCHVMEKECFSDTAVARVMNDHFVSIKVDREERPDVDDIYMTACQLTNESCGWPLNAIALPDGKPIWVGTYFPKDQWIRILEKFQSLKTENPGELQKNAAQITDYIKEMHKGEHVIGNIIPKSDIQNILQTITNKTDKVYGGRMGDSQKFPRTESYDFLLQSAYYYNNNPAKDAALITLDNIIYGGIYDHVEGGFARYTVENKWRIPHFEKMLYDQAGIVSLLANAYKITGNETYKSRITETLQFTDTKLSDKEGGFYSSFDADSEGEEGKYYVWTEAEIDALIKDPALNKTAKVYYNISTKGNWEKGQNVLYADRNVNKTAAVLKTNISQLEEQLKKVNTILRTARDKRTAPHRDDKILTSWNAAMCKAYLDAYTATGDRTYLDRARKNLDFLTTKVMQKDGKLFRNYKGGKATINGFLDDYAFTIQALIEMYQATFEEKWLQQAKLITDYTIKHFYDATRLTFYYTDDSDSKLLSRKIETSDNELPASTAVMATSLYSLGDLLYNDDYSTKAKNALARASTEINKTSSPESYASWLKLASLIHRTPYEIAITGDNSEQFRAEMQKHYLPDAIYLGGKTEGTLELLKGKVQSGSTLIYVCKEKVCKLPQKTVKEALAEMK